MIVIKKISFKAYEDLAVKINKRYPELKFKQIVEIQHYGTGIDSDAVVVFTQKNIVCPFTTIISNPYLK